MHTLRIAHGFPRHLNLYGDRGNLLTLYRRCQWRGIAVDIIPVDIGPIDEALLSTCNLVLLGGGQDSHQRLIAEDLLQYKSATLQTMAEQGALIVGICGGYQLLGHGYQPAQGNWLPGLGLLDCQTIAAPDQPRLIGNISIQVNQQTKSEIVVGFENHGGRTHLGNTVRPWGTVLSGHGNNGVDGTEGAVGGPTHNIIGTYLHGSLLPKNPAIADAWIAQALGIAVEALPPLQNTTTENWSSDNWEKSAHQACLAMTH